MMPMGRETQNPEYFIDMNCVFTKKTRGHKLANILTIKTKAHSIVGNFPMATKRSTE